MKGRILQIIFMYPKTNQNYYLLYITGQRVGRNTDLFKDQAFTEMTVVDSSKGGGFTPK